MGDYKKPVSHLRSAREWLRRAEESYDKNHSIKGELNLFLAKAELQHVEESSSQGKKQIKFKILRQAVAFCLAFLMVSVGIGGVYWLQHGASDRPNVQQQSTVTPKTEPLPLVEAAKSMTTEPAKPIQSKQEGKENNAVTSASPVTQMTQQTSPTNVPKNGVKAEADLDAELVLSPNEMQKLVRAAGKSLRGQ